MIGILRQRSSEIASSPLRGRQSCNPSARSQHVPCVELADCRELTGSEPGFGQMNELRPDAIERLPRGAEARLLHRCDRKRKIFVPNLP